MVEYHSKNRHKFLIKLHMKTRLSKQSQSKRNSGCPKGMTELEWANSRGLSRIWDCGKTRWEFSVYP